MTREELREQVAKAIHNVWREQNSRGDDIANYVTWDEIEVWERTQILYEADAAIALVLEEAAKVVETPIETMCCNNPLWNGNPEDQPECCGKPEYRWGDPGEIAAAIRALIPSEVK